MTQKPETKTEKPETQKPETKTSSASVKHSQADIFRGRMPHAIVYHIRFNEGEAAKNSELAKKYKTTQGKIFDIRTNKNFKYIIKEWRPTKAMLDQANEWLKAAGVEGVKLNFQPVTDEEFAKFKEAHKELFGVRGRKKTESSQNEKSTTKVEPSQNEKKTAAKK